MRKFFEKLWRVVVGGPFGFAGEGNQQWYYTLALAMSCMLAWTFLPEVALVFTIISAIHLITVHLYGINSWDDYGRNYSFGYLAAHAVIFIVALLTNWWWALVTSALVVIAVQFAPDCVTENIITRLKKIEHEEERQIKIAMICHTCIFVLFVIVTCLLPTVWWAKLLIIVAFMGLHVLIDFLEGECVNVYERAEDAFDIVINGSLDEQLQKYLEEQKNKQENTDES